MPRKIDGQVSIYDVDADALNPDPDWPTPIDLVHRLTRPAREKRTERLVEQARTRWAEAQTNLAGKNIAGVCLLTSGGNDSTTIAHLFRDVATHLVHAHTGTGIEATRDFVRQVSADWDLPLIMGLPPEGQRYEDLVRAEARTSGGFPGPASHQFMYDRLKGRFLATIPHHFNISRSRVDRVVFIAGRRRAESQRRADVPFHDVQGTTYWLSPIANWHKADLRMYRQMRGDVPLNPVTEVLGMSGECGCLAYAKGGEADKWKDAYPDDPFIKSVCALEREIADRPDIPEHRKRWGWAGDHRNSAGFVEEPSFGDLCGESCGSDAKLLEMMDPLFGGDL